MRKNRIKGILAGSIADELDIVAGDLLVSVNNEEIIDILDYKFQIFDENIVILVEHSNGELEEYEIEKDENEDLGIIFEEQLIEPARKCANKCIFCFMDQLPPDVRETLLFKDDDFRLSFITGNYVTLTNSSYKDLDRIIKYHLSPINISVHTTNSEVRKMMLNNKNADKIIEYIKYLTEHDIQVNAQIVLCPAINDDEILNKTIEDLSKFVPKLQCIAIVPVGLTKYRDGLFKLDTFDKETAGDVINQISVWQERFKKEIGTNLVYLADEFYILAGAPIPPYDDYGDFPQLEDGIGMLAMFEHEFDEYLKTLTPMKMEKVVSVATGKIAYDFILSKAKVLENMFEGLKINVYPIENEFFGPKITVTGLITGGDLIRQLSDKELGEYLILNRSMLNDECIKFLDDTTLEFVRKNINAEIHITNATGDDFIKSIIGRNLNGK